MIAQVIALVALMVISAFFSASETSLTAIGKIKLAAMIERKMPGAKRVEKLVSDKPRLLSAILIGNNAANVAISTISAALAIKIVGDGGGLILGVTTLIVTFAIVIFCEITPKTLAVRNAEVMSCVLAVPMTFFVKVFTPVSAFIDIILRLIFFVLRVKKGGEAEAVTEEEIKAMVVVGNREGVIREDEKAMLDNVLELDVRRAKDVMTPRTAIIAVASSASYKEVMRVLRDERFSRLPVYKGEIDTIIGVLHLKDAAFLNSMERSAFRAEKYARPPFFSYENKPVAALLSEMRADNVPVAIILDEYGGTSGIVTIEDLIEEIVGDINDEYDEEPVEIQRLSDVDFAVEGSEKLGDFNEISGGDLQSDDYESIGGYALGLFGKIPEQGDSVEGGGFKFTVELIDRNRIKKLKVTKIIDT